MLSDRNVDRRAKFLRRLIDVAHVTATTQTKVPFFAHKPGSRFTVEAVEQFCSTLAGTVTPDVRIAGASEVVVTGAFAVHSTAEQFTSGGTIWATVNGVLVKKALQAALTFSAAHVITASTYGIILIQMNASGTFSTKVPSATQAYASAAAALAALPAADSDKVAVAYLAIANNAGDWTANTDDLTNGSDVTTAAFTNATEARSVLTPAAYAAGTVVPTVSTTLATVRGEATDMLVGLYTSDGSGALTNGQFRLTYLPRW